MSRISSERLMALIEAFINAPTWDESRRIVEEHPELLTDEAHALLDRLVAERGDDPRAAQVLTEHRDLLHACREEGIEAAFEERAAGHSEAEATLEGRLRQAIGALVETDSPSEVVETLQAYPLLLGEAADALIRQGIENARQEGNEEMAEHVAARYAVVQQVRASGVDPGRLAEAQERINAALAGLPEHLQQVLTDVSSSEELEAALEAHPELREALQQARGGDPSE